MADPDVEIKTSLLGAFVGLRARTKPHRQRQAEETPTAQDQRKTLARNDKRHGERQRTETLAEQADVYKRQASTPSSRARLPNTKRWRYALPGIPPISQASRTA